MEMYTRILQGIALILTLRTSLATVYKTTCEATSEGVGKNATLTCKFQFDISKVKRSIYVEHFANGNSSPESILVCRWSDGDFICKPHGEYQMVGNLTSQLTINIPETQPKHYGKYSCEVFDVHPDNCRACELNLALKEEGNSSANTRGTMFSTVMSAYIFTFLLALK